MRTLNHATRTCAFVYGAAIIAGLAHANPADAQSAADFYKNQTVTLYVGGSAGGGVSTAARIFIRHLEGHVPGRPTIIIKNMPGAGGMQAVQFLYNVAPKDGTAFGTSASGPIKEPFLGGRGVNYELTEMQWLGSLFNDVTLCFTWHASPVKTIADARKQEVRFAATGARSNSTLVPLLVNAVTGSKLIPVAGYKGGDAMLAVIRGEMDGRCLTLNSLRGRHPDLIKEKKLHFLVQLAAEKDPDFQDVPLLKEFAKGEKEQRAIEFFLIPLRITQPYFMPPGVPADRVQAFREAFAETVKDRGFLSEAKKQRLEVDPNTGEQVAGLIEKMKRTPKEVIELAVQFTDPSGRIQKRTKEK